MSLILEIGHMLKFRTTQEIQHTKRGSDREVANKSPFSKMKVTKGK